MSAQWLLMVYMAGDNGKQFPDGKCLMGNLTEAGWADLREMASVGSSDRVKVVAQFDTLDSREFTQRFLVRSPEQGLELVGQVPPVNTGNPESLTDFIVWAMESYPSERVALILWNHGSGWDDEDIYARYREAEERLRADRLRGCGPRRLGRLLFLSSAAQVITLDNEEERAICFDDSSMDFLDNTGLDAALGAAAQRIGRRLDLIGMDACLMAAAEVAFALRPHASFMVASQELEHADGWPYARILSALQDDPGIQPAALARLIVDAFAARYASITRSPTRWTLSALNLAELTPAFDALAQLSGYLANEISTDFALERELKYAQKAVRRFSRPIDDQVDLGQLLRLVKSGYGGPLSGAIGELQGRLLGQAIERNWCESTETACGLSIYLPLAGFSQYYERQAFAQTGWGRVVRALNRVSE